MSILRSSVNPACLSSTARWTVATRTQLITRWGKTLRMRRVVVVHLETHHFISQLFASKFQGHHDYARVAILRVHLGVHSTREWPGATRSVGGRSETNLQCDFHLPSCYRNFYFTNLLFLTCLEPMFAELSNSFVTISHD